MQLLLVAWGSGGAVSVGKFWNCLKVSEFRRGRLRWWGGGCGLLRAALAISCHRQLSRVKFMLLFFSCHHFHIISDAVQQAAVRRGGTAELCDEGHEQWQVTTLSLPDNARSAAWGRDAARQRRRRHHFEQLLLYSIPSGKSAVELRALFGVPVELEGSTAHTMPYRCLGVGPDREQQLRLGKSKEAAWLQNEVMLVRSRV